MPVEIKVPSVGESITEVTLVKWIRKDGDWVRRMPEVSSMAPTMGLRYCSSTDDAQFSKLTDGIFLVLMSVSHWYMLSVAHL